MTRECGILTVPSQVMCHLHNQVIAPCLQLNPILFPTLPLSYPPPSTPSTISTMSACLDCLLSLFQVPPPVPSQCELTQEALWKSIQVILNSGKAILDDQEELEKNRTSGWLSGRKKQCIMYLIANQIMLIDSRIQWTLLPSAFRCLVVVSQSI